MLKCPEIFCLVALAALCAPPPAVAAIPPPMASALRDAGVPESAVSLYVREVGGAEPFISHRASTAMNPASTMKIVTTLVGLDVLTPAYAWQTTFSSNARLSAGVLHGALYVKGSGDPKFVTDHLQAAIKGLRERGVREIAGDLIIDRSRFAPITHDANAFDGLPRRPYNVGPDALLFNFKTVGFRLSPQTDGSVRVMTDGPAPDGLSIDNRLRSTTGACPTDWRSRTQPTFDDRGNAVTATFSGVYATDCGDRDWYVSLFDHSGLFAGMFARLWRDAGGVWQGQVKSGGVPRNARVLYTHTSAPLATMVTDINKFSNNVMARQLLLTIDAELSKRPGQARRAAKSVREWAGARGFDLPELVIENGSGLSRNERISARSLAGLLEYGLTAPFASDFLSSLPLAATDGTLAKRFVNQAAEGNAWLKTGTLTGVKALAGYLLLPDGRKMLYVAIVNHANAEAAQRALDAGVDWVYQTQAQTARPASTLPAR
ncbi:MAG: D-alanyl-D-alanine carboxypeptidase/D-alanyl-D-alanine-endopeptidase [Burkholderiales bacterium]|nr:D-alanyl-D-alanine carboxypeptidase/D-alanyl-D-alanine-endopeptidase [Burkholderiales bacterium]